MISPKKIGILLSPERMRAVFQKKVKSIGLKKKTISRIDIKVVKKYTDWRSFSLVAVYTLDGKKKVVGIANSDGRKKYALYANKFLFKKFAPFKKEGFFISEPFCYIKSLGLFLREYLEGNNFGQIISSGKNKTFHLEKIAETVAKLQSVKGKFSTLRNGIDFSDMEKNIKILKQRKLKEAGPLARFFKKIKKEIITFQRKNKNKVLVHGDLNPYNCFFDGKNVKLADFDSLHLGDRVSDAASFLAHLNTGLDFPLPQKVRASMENEVLNLYQKLTERLSEMEENKLAIYKSYFDLLIISHILVWGNRLHQAKILKKFESIKI